MTTIDQGLAAFGVAPESGPAYLLDREICRIIGEGPWEPSCAVARAWGRVASGRYTIVTADDVDPAILQEWQQFKAHNPTWAIPHGEGYTREASQ